MTTQPQQEAGEVMRRIFAQLGTEMNKGMTAWREAHGIPEWRDPGYLGRRNGWYPQKPKRARRRCGNA